MSINSSKLDRLITLQEPTQTSDGQGGYVTTYPTMATVWAEFMRPGMQQLEAIGTVVSELTQLVRIRYRSDVCRGWRLGYGSRTYDILDKYEDGRNSAVVLICRELAI